MDAAAPHTDGQHVAAQHASRLERTRAFMSGHALDALVVRETADVRWLTGFEGVFDDERAHTAVVTAEAARIHTDSRYATAMRMAAEGGVWDVDCEASLTPSSFARAALDGAEGMRIGIDAATPLAEYRALERDLPDSELVELADPLLSLRAVKDDGELAALRRAQDIASAAFLATLSSLTPGRSERDVSWMLERQMRERGADGLAFANIVASGPNSANPHAQPAGRVLGRGDVVVFDFGAMKDGYRSDTTRVACIGEPADEVRRVYAAVRDAHEEVARTLRPGATGREMHELALSVLAESGLADVMGHSLGHGVGLDIHELPVLGVKNDRPLEVGNVVTVEPGAYLPNRFGVRLEDCGVVTGCGWQSFCTLDHAIFEV